MFIAILYFTFGAFLSSVLLNQELFEPQKFEDESGLVDYLASVLSKKQMLKLLKMHIQRFPNIRDGTFDDVNDLAIMLENWSRRSDLVSENRLRRKMLMHAPSCQCKKKQQFSLDEEMDDRRRNEARLWQHKEQANVEPLSVCKSMSPLSYIGSGIVVEPLQVVRIVGLKLDPVLNQLYSNQIPQSFTVYVKTVKNLGKLLIHGRIRHLRQYSNFSIEGNGTGELLVSSNKLISVNFVLDNLMYKSTFYDINIRDIIEATFMSFSVHIHIHTRRKTLPDLYDVGPEGALADKLTVITKTFERYEAVNRLVESINYFYPDLRIVVADDSEDPQRIRGKNVKQTYMPFAEGLFAGRGVALSQVTTKYFLWVDDDFVFTEKTKLERMMQKLDESRLNLDVIGGTVNKTSYNKCFMMRTGGQDGDCLHAIHGRYRRMVQFPECDIVDVVVDFFMARTSVVRQVGFDPEYRRIGHTSFFIDGLGKMRVAMCHDVDVDHQPVRNAKYMQYRARLIDKEDPRRHNNHLKFNNNLRCI